LVSQPSALSSVRFGPDGLVPVVAQDARSGDVLMVAHANREALERTLATGDAHYYSRSRAALWRKGETSGHVQRISEVRLDCDGDTVLYRVRQTGPACHTGSRTCFDTVVGAAQAGPSAGTNRARNPADHILDRLATTVAGRAAERPTGSYTARLLEAGVPAVARKVGEEAVEVVVAATAEDDGRLAAEAADLLYHLVVLFQARGVPLDAAWRELEARHQ
jgi:phosphoribosyl-ATP pyrophosphohydrolase/phosphoribosyl-AMP cyclohydrolase